MAAAPSPPNRPGDYQRGLWAGIGAFFLWGLFPLYWHRLAGVESITVAAHRTLWCAVTVWAGLFLWQGKRWLAPLTPRLVGVLLVSGILIAINWGVYVWAVAVHRVVEASLGYYLNPLFSVLLGIAVLKERLHPRQWLAVGLAAAGVAWLTLRAGGLPWVALVLAVSFAFYGLIRKLAPVEALTGLAVESGWLAPAALGWILFHPLPATAWASPLTITLLGASGVVTAVPLALFAYGARRVPLSVVGFIQYLGPTLQFIIGVLVFNEPFDTAHAVGFGFIWTAVLVFLADGVWQARTARMAIAHA